MKIKPILPKEHGAWGMVFTPFFIAAGMAWCFDLKMVFLLFSIFFFYVARRPFEELIGYGSSRKQPLLKKRILYLWLIAYMFSGFLFTIPLIYKYQLYWLVLFGGLFTLFMLINVVQIKIGNRRSVSGELIGIGGLCITAPMGYYVATGSMGWFNFFAWCAIFLYYSRSVFYVKLRVRAVSAKGQFPNALNKVFFAWRYISCHFGMLAAVYIISLLSHVEWVVIAYIPITMQSMYGISKLDGKLNIKSLGYIEVFHSILFGAAIVLVCH